MKTWNKLRRVWVMPGRELSNVASHIGLQLFPTFEAWITKRPASVAPREPAMQASAMQAPAMQAPATQARAMQSTAMLSMVPPSAMTARPNQLGLISAPLNIQGTQLQGALCLTQIASIQQGSSYYKSSSNVSVRNFKSFRLRSYKWLRI